MNTVVGTMVLERPCQAFGEVSAVEKLHPAKASMACIPGGTETEKSHWARCTNCRAKWSGWFYRDATPFSSEILMDLHPYVTNYISRNDMKIDHPHFANLDLLVQNPQVGSLYNCNFDGSDVVINLEAIIAISPKLIKSTELCSTSGCAVIH